MDITNSLKSLLQNAHQEQHDNTCGEPAAVTVCLLPEDDSIKVLLLKRAVDLERHAGEISFPGGVPDPQDADLLETAVRETKEETGLDPTTCGTLAGQLNQVCTQTGFLISPFLFVLTPPLPPLTPHPKEVKKIFWADLGSMISTETTVSARGKTWPCFKTCGETVWGATGRIIKQLLDMLQNQGFLRDT